MWHTVAMEMTEKQKATQRKNKTGKIGSVRRDEIENEEIVECVNMVQFKRRYIYCIYTKQKQFRISYDVKS